MPLPKFNTTARHPFDLLGGSAKKYSIRLIFVLLSLLVVFFHKILPPKKFDFASSDFTKNLFYTAQAGGKTTAKWIDKSAHHFQCDFKLTSSASGEYCGVLFLLPNVDPFKTFDLSNYTYIEVDLEYMGETSQLRLSINTHKDGMLKDDGELLDFPMSYRIREPGSTTQVKAKIDHFQIPSWWLNNWLHKLSLTMEEARPNTQSTFSVGVDIPFSTQGLTGLHDIKINSFTARGRWIDPATLYFTILALWLLFEGITSSWQLYQLRLQNREKGEIIDQLASLNKVLEDKSTSDPLTGLLNREGFLLQVRALKREHYTVIILDLDHFKSVNDNHGHPIGDVVLKRTSEILENYVRKSDFVGRWGGEEFIILCPKTTINEAKFLAEKIRTTIRSNTLHEDITQPVTVSLGVAEKLQSNEDFPSVLKRSDDALYKSKNNGRDKVTLSKA